MGSLLQSLDLPKPKVAPASAATGPSAASKAAAAPSPQMKALVRRIGGVFERIQALKALKAPEAAALHKAAVAAGNMATSPRGIAQAEAALDQVEVDIAIVQRRLDEAPFSGGKLSSEPGDEPAPVMSAPPAPIGPAVPPPSFTPSQGLTGTGAVPTQQPVSLAVGGLPAFRFNAPAGPVASATVDTPMARIEITLSLRGSVTVTFPNAPRGVSTDVDRGGWRVEAQQALGPITQGFRVSGLGTATPSVGLVNGTRFSTSECRFEPPSTMVFIGQSRYDDTVPSARLGKVAVQGALGFELRVTVIPKQVQLVPVPVEKRATSTQRSWFAENQGPLAALGVVALVVLVVATDGFGLLAIEGGGFETAALGGAAL